MSGVEAATSPLQALLDAFNAHDLDAIMASFTEDCVFDTPRGPAPCGRRLVVGKEQVRKGFQARFDGVKAGRKLTPLRRSKIDPLF